MTLEAVSSALSGYDEFIRVDKDGYTVFNYLVAKPDTFSPKNESDDSWMIRRECRGLIFPHDGAYPSRSFHKFFNINERPETQWNNLPFHRPFQILAKLDGSMIRPIYFNDGFRLGTKMGITEISMMAECLVATDRPLFDLIMDHKGSTYLPIFEYIGPKNRVVVEYAKERLVLTALRNVVDGSYVDHDTLRRIASSYIGVNVVAKAEIQNPEEAFYRQRMAELTGIEGYIVKWFDGHMVKAKVDWYINLHHLREDVARPHRIIQLHLSNSLDDLVAKLPETDQRIVNEVVAEFEEIRSRRLADLLTGTQIAMAKYGTNKKAFALGDGMKMTPYQRQAVFVAMGGGTLNDFLDKVIEKAVSSKKTYDEWRTP